MKRLFKFLAILPLLAFGFTSCNDDNDLPNVDITLNISGAESVDGTIYLVQGDTLYIDAIDVTNNEPGKAAFISSATYYWDYVNLGTAVVPPYSFAIATNENTPVGRHLLQVEAPVAAVDKELGIAVLTYVVEVVESADDIPAGTPQNQVLTVPRYK